MVSTVADLRAGFRATSLPSFSEKPLRFSLGSVYLRTSGFQSVPRAFLNKDCNEINEELLFVEINHQGPAHRSPRGDNARIHLLCPPALPTADSAGICLRPVLSLAALLLDELNFSPLPFLSLLPTSLPPSLVLDRGANTLK